MTHTGRPVTIALDPTHAADATHGAIIAKPLRDYIGNRRSYVRSEFRRPEDRHRPVIEAASVRFVTEGLKLAGLDVPNHSANVIARSCNDPGMGEPPRANANLPVSGGSTPTGSRGHARTGDVRGSSSVPSSASPPSARGTCLLPRGHTRMPPPPRRDRTPRSRRGGPLSPSLTCGIDRAAGCFLPCSVQQKRVAPPPHHCQNRIARSSAHEGYHVLRAAHP